jgi:hypothetical protein
MSFNSRNYHFYLIFGDSPSGKEPWTKAKWTNEIQPILDTILRKSPNYGKTGLKTLQYLPRENSQYFDEAKFGRLGWNQKSHDKWTLTPDDTTRKFVNLNSWTPIKTVCDKNETAPDIYLNICSESYLAKSYLLQFNVFIVLAIAEDLNFDGHEQVIALSKVVNARKAVYKTRTWGGSREKNKELRWEFVNSISDTKAFGIYKAETMNLHDTKFENIVFEPYWKIIYSK